MILAMCLNPALQRTLRFQNLSFNRVNRAESVSHSAGGKGVNVAGILSTLKSDVRLLTLLGGVNGRQVKAILKRDKIRFHAVPVCGNTRICTTLLDPAAGIQTELVEEGEPVSTVEVRDVDQAFEKMLPRSRILILSGTAPRGFPDTVYRKWIARAKNLGIPAILDAPKRLAENGLKANPWLFKPNWGEMETLVGSRIDSDEMLKSALEFLHAKGAENILVTRDGPCAFAFWDRECVRIISPNLKVANPIGSGDAFAAGIAAAWLFGKKLPEMLKLGMACAGANVLTPLAGTLRLADVKVLIRRIRIETF